MKNRKIESFGFLKYIKHVSEFFIFISLAVIIVNSLLDRVFGLKLFDTTAIFIHLAPILTVSIVVMFNKLLKEVLEELHLIKKTNIGILEVLHPEKDNVNHKELLQSKKNIKILTLSGSTVVPLEDETVKSIILSPHRKSSISILIANPYSQHIIDRYTYDEPSDSEAGVEKIKERIVKLFCLIDSEKLRENNGNKFNVRLYDNYPTISIFAADNLVYTSHYGFRLRGADTPTLCADRNEFYGEALMKHFYKIFDKYSVPIRHWIDKYNKDINYKYFSSLELQYSGIFLRHKNGDFIFQRRDSCERIANAGMLSVFGGRKKDDEEPLSTALREIEEETNLSINRYDLDELRGVPIYLPEEKRYMYCVYYIANKPVDDIKRFKVIEGAGYECYSIEEVLARDDLTEGPRFILENEAEKIHNKALNTDSLKLAG